MKGAWIGGVIISLLAAMSLASMLAPRAAAAKRRAPREGTGSATTRLKLITWNVDGALFTAEHVKERFTAIAGEIRRRQPDVVLLQEVVRPADAALLDRALADYRRAEAVPTKWFFFWRIRKGGVIAYVRRDSRWKITRTGFHPFAARPDWWKLWDRDSFDDKGIEFVELQDRAGQPLVLLNTHLQAYGSQYDEIRHNQARELFRFGSRFAGPVIAAGDFNMPPSVLEPLVPPEWTELTEPKRAACGCGTFRDTRYWVDYVFGRTATGAPAEAEIELIRGSASGEALSDHRGVEARIRFEPTAAHARPEGLLLARNTPPNRVSRKWCLTSGTSPTVPTCSTRLCAAGGGSRCSAPCPGAYRGGAWSSTSRRCCRCASPTPTSFATRPPRCSGSCTRSMPPTSSTSS